MNTDKYNSIKSTLDNLKTGGCSTLDSHGDFFEEILGIVRPKNILEIGFFMGGSASLFLNLCDANLTSVDPINDTPIIDFLHSTNQSDQVDYKTEKLQMAAINDVLEKYPDRFKFIKKRSLQAALDGDLSKEKYDFIFIDGSHWEADVTIDLNIAIQLKIPFLLIDDFNQTNDGVRMAYSKMQNKFQPIRFYQKDHKEHNTTIEMLLAVNLTLGK